MSLGCGKFVRQVDLNASALPAQRVTTTANEFDSVPAAQPLAVTYCTRFNQKKTLLAVEQLQRAVSAMRS
jgi:hypothetical protein